MTDRLTPVQRSRNMARIKGKNTGPELVVRRLLFGLGYRYRLHGTDLPGRPDIVFSRRRKVVLIHGCFWHRHPACRYAYTPKSRPEFWGRKFEQNVARDNENLCQLDVMGWGAMIVWECETRDLGALRDRLTAFLGDSRFVGEAR